MQSTSQLDRFISRVLFVTPPPIREVSAVDAEAQANADADAARSAENVFGLSLFFSGVRCLFQYALLPFLLPIIGIAGDFATHVSMVINVVAIVAIIASLRRFWKIDYKHKYQYLFVAVVALFLLISFLVLDFQALVA